MAFPVISTPLNEDLQLPIPGADGTVTVYRVAPCTADVWVRLTALNVGVENEILRQAWLAVCDRQRKSGVPEEDLPKEPSYEPVDEGYAQVVSMKQLQDYMLGEETAQAMRDNGVRAEHMKVALLTANVWHLSGGDQAAAMVAWSGKARVQLPEIPSGKAGDADSTTKNPGSGNTTTPE